MAVRPDSLDTHDSLPSPEAMKRDQIVLTTILLCFMTIALVNRVYMKLRWLKEFRWDDGRSSHAITPQHQLIYPIQAH